MPRIIIDEKENEVMSLLSPTSNTVLIPLVCKYGSSKEAKYYSQDKRASFISDFKDFVVKQSVGEFTTPIYEKSFMYANMLLTLGIGVVIKPIVVESSSESSEGDEFTEAYLASFISSEIEGGAFEEFKDKNIFNIKFITTGAHANMCLSSVDEGCYKTLAAIAQIRSDCIALMELPEDVTCSSNSEDPRDIKKVLAGQAETDDAFKFAACMFPWGYYKVSDGVSIHPELKMPASFGYLSAFANSIQNNADWYAIAGTVRGSVPNLVRLTCEVGESAMHVLLAESPDGSSSISNLRFCVNPIMQILEYGKRIWGNKVALINTTTESYRSYLNVRMLICDIKKQIYYAATRVTFEPNDMITWLNFTNLANELLDEMQSNRGIEWYSWRRKATDKKATIKAVLTLKPIEAVEYFDIMINLTSEEAEAEEV